MYHGKGVRGPPYRGRNRTLGQGTQVGLERAEGLRRDDVVLEGRTEAQDVENQALDALTMRRRLSPRMVYRGGPIKAERRRLEGLVETVEAMGNLGIGGSPNTDRKGRVWPKGCGEAVKDGEGGVGCAGRAPIEGKVQGSKLRATRTRRPGKGETSCHDVPGSPNQTVPPEAVGQEGQRRAVGSAQVGGVVDPKDGQLAPHRRGGKEGEQLRQYARREVAGEEMGGIMSTQTKGRSSRSRRDSSQRSTEPLIVGEKEASVAVIGNGVAEQGMGGQSGPRVEFKLGKA